MTREDLLKSKEYWQAEIQTNLFNLIEQYRSDNHLNKTQLANKLGFSKGYITQILNGDFDHKISKLVELALAFGKVPVITYEDLEHVIECDSLNLPVQLYGKLNGIKNPFNEYSPLTVKEDLFY